jgi:DNA-binding transcriptional MerR regulator
MFSAMPESPVMEEDVMEEPVMIVPIPEEPKAIPSEPVIFADERIVVKLKQQATVPASPSPAVAVNRTKTAGKRGRKSFKEIDSEVDLINVPDEEVLKQKLYYSISEVAGWFNVNTSLLRYWENEFDILQPRKTRKGDRLFRAEDIRNLQLIYYLLRQRKFSIAGARNYLKTNKKKVDTQTQLVQSLTKFKSFLLELKATL